METTIIEIVQQQQQQQQEEWYDYYHRNSNNLFQVVVEICLVMFCARKLFVTIFRKQKQQQRSFGFIMSSIRNCSRSINNRTAAAAAAAAAAANAGPQIRSMSYDRSSIISESSHTTSSSASTSDEDEEDSILAAISTLFREEEDDFDFNDDFHNRRLEDTATTIKKKNGIVGRLLPRNQIEYERRKPIHRSCDPMLLRRRLEEDDDDIESSTTATTRIEKLEAPYQGEGTLHSTSSDGNKDDNNDLVALLEVDSTIASSCTPSIRYHVEMKMHRQADEPAVKTLRRLAISLQKKIWREERQKMDECTISSSDLSHAEKAFFSSLKHNKHDKNNDAVVTVWVQDDSNGTTPQESSTSTTSSSDEETEMSTPEEEIEASGYSSRRVYPVPEDMTVSELWQNLRAFHSCQLCIHFPGYQAFDVSLLMEPCPPTILSVQNFENFGASVFVGVPLVVDVQVLHASRAAISWFADGKVVCRDSCVYTPKIDDVGKELSVLIAPVRDGHHYINLQESYSFESKVAELPDMPLISPLRKDWMTREKSDPRIRIMSYNLLADMYVTRDMDQHIMYGHCPAEYLGRKRRMLLLVYEMLVYQPNVICLQEVDASIYSSLFDPVLRSQGYLGFYSNKSSAQLEGCAIFWSRRVFGADSIGRSIFLKELFKHHHHKDHLAYGRWESLDDIDGLLEGNDELNKIATEKIGQVLQIAELRLLNPGKDAPDRILVGNTHLFYHPMADHIRTMQAYMVCRQMEIERSRREPACPLVICGDFNSNPLSGAVQLFLQRKVGPENHDSWRHLKDYEWGMGDADFLLEHGFIGNEVDAGDPVYEDEAFEDALQTLDQGEVRGPRIRLPPCFPRLVSAYSKIPEFTNYAVDFVETLDYILVSQPSKSDEYGLVSDRAAAMPTSSLIEQHGAMPNQHMPSDHISLVCDLDFKRYDG